MRRFLKLWWSLIVGDHREQYNDVRGLKMLWSQENAKKVLNRLVEKPSVTGAARLLGASSKLVWIWCRNSARDKANGIADSKYIIHGWPDDDADSAEQIWFHDAVALSRTMHALNFDAETREGLGGIERPVIEGGRFQYAVDPLAIAMWRDAKEAEAFGGLTDWPYQHDDNGARVVLTVLEQPPAQLKIHALRALMPQIYNIPDRKIVDSVSESSVLVLHGDATRPNTAADSPLRRDLEEKLRALRERKALERPSLPPRVEVGKADDEPPEGTDAAAAQRPQIDVLDHPRAYEIEPLSPPRPAPNYARPPGGFSIVK